MQIEVEVKGQRIKRINSPGSVEDTLNYLTCHFTFDGSEWENTIKTAYFKNRATEKIYSSLIADDGTCTVPWESLTDKGFVEFSAAGERENYRITTGIESFYNSKTVYGGEPSEPPTPDQYDQLIALAQETKEIAESVREDANEGKFDGEPGKQGNPGRDGVSPTAKVEQTDDGAVITITDATGTTTAKLKNGKDGNPGQDATDEQVQAAVEAYMEEHPIQGDTEDIIKLAIKNEASGAVPVVIADSAEMGVQDIKMQGRTEQAQYEGKNLLSVDVGQEFDGIVVTDSATFEEDGVHAVFESIVSGEARDIYVYGNSHPSVEDSYVEVPILTPGDYRLVNDNIGISLYVVAWRNGASVVLGYADNATTKITIQDGDKFRIFLRCNIIGDTDVKIHPMIVKEGEDTTQYEPYTGGQPSPNPDYPQEITSAGNYNAETQKYEYEVKLTAKNVFVLQDLVDKVAETSNPAIGVILTITGLKPGTRYTLSASIDGSISGVYLNRCLYLGGNDGGSSVYNGHPVTKTTDSNGDIQIWFYGGRNESQTILDGQGNVQLEEGVSATEYEAYKEQLVTLTADRPLTKWDKLEKRNGQLGWVYKSDEVVLDGSEDEDWMYQADANRKIQFYITLSDALYPYSEPFEEMFYCDTFLTTNNPGAIPKWQVRKGTYNGLAPVFKPSDDIDTVELFRNFLAENQTTILYVTKEETFIPLSESEQEQMNDLHTYYPTTTVSNDAGCDMSLTYIADTKAYIDNKIAAIQAAIVNTI